MKRDQSICPNCGSGDVELRLRRPEADDLFSSIPFANRHCFVCGIRWGVDDLDLDSRTA